MRFIGLNEAQLRLGHLDASNHTVCYYSTIMNYSLAISFLVFSGIFAAVHYVAVIASLYWYHWWFDIMMHFWGGLLVALGVHTLSTFSRLHFLPNAKTVFTVLIIMMIGWEAFELVAGLWDPETYLTDTLKDVLVGFGGGLLAHSLLRPYTMK